MHTEKPNQDLRHGQNKIKPTNFTTHTHTHIYTQKTTSRMISKIFLKFVGEGKNQHNSLYSQAHSIPSSSQNPFMVNIIATDLSATHKWTGQNMLGK